MIQSDFSYIKAAEFCCSYGLRLIVIDSSAKYDCMIQAGVRKFLY
jgi:hypothetical protein